VIIIIAVEVLDKQYCRSKCLPFPFFFLLIVVDKKKERGTRAQNGSGAWPLKHISIKQSLGLKKISIITKMETSHSAPLMTIQQIGGKYKKKKVLFTRADRNAKKDILASFRGKFDHRPPPPLGPRTVAHEKRGFFSSDRFIKTGVMKLQCDTSPTPFTAPLSIVSSPQSPTNNISTICTSPINVSSPSERHFASKKMNTNVHMTTGRLLVQSLPVHRRDTHSPMRPPTGSNTFQNVDHGFHK
jgi:hypothetical protein